MHRMLSDRDAYSGGGGPIGGGGGGFSGNGTGGTPGTGSGGGSGGGLGIWPWVMTLQLYH